jgi:hypothetical protein
MKFRASIRRLTLGAFALSIFVAACGVTSSAAQTTQKPNILFIMGDDIGWMQPCIEPGGVAKNLGPNPERGEEVRTIFLAS